MKPLIITGPAPPQAAGSLNETEKAVILAYADNRMRAYTTANQLFRSKNGVDYHLDRIYKKTGLNPRDFFDLQQLVAIASGTDFFEVTRCADCEYSKHAYTNDTGVKICPETGLFFHEDDYCSHAIRSCKKCEN